MSGDTPDEKTVPPDKPPVRVVERFAQVVVRVLALDDLNAFARDGGVKHAPDTEQELEVLELPDGLVLVKGYNAGVDVVQAIAAADSEAQEKLAELERKTARRDADATANLRLPTTEGDDT